MKPTQVWFLLGLVIGLQITAPLPAWAVTAVRHAVLIYVIWRALEDKDDGQMTTHVICPSNKEGGNRMITSAHVVVDMTRTYPNLVPEVVGNVRRFVDTIEGETQMWWLVGCEQQAALADVPGALVVLNGDVAGAVTRLLEDSIADHHHGYVLSFTPEVLRAAVQYASRGVTPLHMSMLTRAERSEAARADTGWRFGHLIHEGDAVQLFRQAISELARLSPGQGIRQSDIKPRMALHAPQLRGPAVATNSLGMISTLVTIGERQGWLRVEGSPPNPFIFPMDGRSPACLAPRQLDGQADVALRGGHPFATPQKMAVPEDSSSRRSRSDEMERVLRFHRIGSHPEPRRLFYAAMRDLLAHSPDEEWSATSLCVAAAAKVRQTFSEDGREEAHRWPKLETCLTRPVLRAGALLDGEGEPIRDGIGALSAKVGGLADDFETLCEAEMLGAILQDCSPVLLDERETLAGALYRDRSPRGQERVDEVLKCLNAQGRLSVQPNGTLKLWNPERALPDRAG